MPQTGPPASAARPVALTIAGSDSGGGAGIQADLKTFHQFGVFGTSAITAITAQNTVGVHAVHAIPVATVRAQIQAVATDLTPRACKTGMLATAELVEAVVREANDLALPNLVVDPVMVASSGDRLLDEDAERTVRTLLLPRADLITPNLHEAHILTGMDIHTEADLERVAERILEMGAGAVLLKGGHLEGGEAVDLLLAPGLRRIWRRARLQTRNTHGTGCTLSAAITAGLAQGRSLGDAVDQGIDFVARAIATAPDLGAGHGPVNHFVPAHPGQD